MNEVRLPIGKEHFGAAWVKGLNNFFPDLAADLRVRALGLLDACPDPSGLAKKLGLEWMINRYTECNLTDYIILAKADELNPKLAKQLRGVKFRPLNERPRNFDPKAVPWLYRFMVLAGSNSVRYAGSRILIEQFGRNPPWLIGDKRVKKGFFILERTIQESSTPEEFLAKLSGNVTSAEADADKDAVLSHMFAVELEEEGTVFIAKKVARDVKKYAYDLWKHYLSLSDEQKKQKGITTVSLEN